jgi:hypothetical protein
MLEKSYDSPDEADVKTLNPKTGELIQVSKKLDFQLL